MKAWIRKASVIPFALVLYFAGSARAETPQEAEAAKQRCQTFLRDAKTAWEGAVVKGFDPEILVEYAILRATALELCMVAGESVTLDDPSGEFHALLHIDYSQGKPPLEVRQRHADRCDGAMKGFEKVVAMYEAGLKKGEFFVVQKAGEAGLDLSKTLRVYCVESGFQDEHSRNEAGATSAVERAQAGPQCVAAARQSVQMAHAMMAALPRAGKQLIRTKVAEAAPVREAVKTTCSKFEEVKAQENKVWAELDAALGP